MIEMRLKNGKGSVLQFHRYTMFIKEMEENEGYQIKLLSEEHCIIGKIWMEVKGKRLS